jgi:hypothetical protein
MRHPKLKQWHAWHDDGRYAVVSAADDRAALNEALEQFEEVDINTVTVEECEPFGYGQAPTAAAE